MTKRRLTSAKGGLPSTRCATSWTRPGAAEAAGGGAAGGGVVAGAVAEGGVLAGALCAAACARPVHSREPAVASAATGRERALLIGADAIRRRRWPADPVRPPGGGGRSRRGG